MGHFVYLNTSDNDGPPNRDEALPAHDVPLRSMKGHVPPLWLALFRPEDLRWGTAYLSSGDLCWEPYLVARREDCVALYQQRRNWLWRVFRHHRKAIEAWESAIRALDVPYLKLELDEIREVIEDFSDTRVMDACALFDGVPEADLTGLVRLTGEWTYDGANGAFVWHAANAHWVANDGDLMGVVERRPEFLGLPLGVLMVIMVTVLAALLYTYW